MCPALPHPLMRRSAPSGLPAAVRIGSWVTIEPNCVLRSCIIGNYCKVGVGDAMGTSEASTSSGHLGVIRGLFKFQGQRRVRHAVCQHSSCNVRTGCVGYFGRRECAICECVESKG
jgi:hypothetical protein